MDNIKLSKTMSYALRHAPWEYELELDENGFVALQQLLFSLKEEKKWSGLRVEDIIDVVKTSDKGRFEISGDKIRALYGHSIPNKIIMERKEPPQTLYHGTTREFTKKIMENGLLPKGRQYVHLAVDIDMAIQVGKRRDDKPVLLKVNAQLAWSEGVAFYKGNDKVWLADMVESKYIEVT
ncbi:MAG: RNA 2'-phosphotransferase [Bacillota bacterium]|nr:RNA 2'-phosphotransferase [Bacillota bacterium]